MGCRGLRKGHGAGFHDWEFEIETVSTGAEDPRDPARATAELVEYWREEGDTVVVKDGSQPDSGTVVIVARDWRALSANDYLPPSIWEDREDGLYGSMFDEAGEVLDSIGMAVGADDLEGAETDQDIRQWYFEAPILTPKLVRYNPIEGLSVGSRLVRDYPWGRGALTVRMGTRRREPSIDLAAEYGRTGPRVRFSLYHTLRESGGTVTSQRSPRWAYVADPSDYYVVRGAAIHLLPPRSDRSWTSLSLFSETNTTLDGDARRRHGSICSGGPGGAASPDEGERRRRHLSAGTGRRLSQCPPVGHGHAGPAPAGRPVDGPGSGWCARRGGPRSRGDLEAREFR